jgi:hypothetical protein
MRPLLNRFGNEPGFTLILFTLDETTFSRELAPLAGHYPAVRLGPPWWFYDSWNGMTRFINYQHRNNAAPLDPRQYLGGKLGLHVRLSIDFKARRRAAPHKFAPGPAEDPGKNRRLHQKDRRRGQGKRRRDYDDLALADQRDSGGVKVECDRSARGEGALTPYFFHLPMGLY